MKRRVKEYIQMSFVMGIAMCLTSCMLFDEAKVSIDVLHTQITGVEQISTQTQTFHGIPYAQPPIGALRFAEPKPFNVFTQTTSFDASKQEPSCIQASHFMKVRIV